MTTYKKTKIKKLLIIKNILSSIFLIMILVIVAYSSFIIGERTYQKNHPIETVDNSQNYYALYAKIIDVDNCDNLLTIEDTKKDLWQWEGIDTWHKYERVILIMDSRGTARKTDDKIIKIERMYKTE